MPILPVLTLDNDDCGLASNTDDVLLSSHPEEMRDEEVHTIPPELRILLDPGTLDNPPIRAGGGRNGGFPFSFLDIPRKGQKEGVEDGISQPKDPVIPSLRLFPGPREPEEVQGSIDVALSVKCDNEKMTVAVEKDSFQVSATP